jgi:hypothetical protein
MMTKYRLILVLALAWAGLGATPAQEPTPAPASALFTYQVAHDHRIGRNTGELLITADGFEYRGTGHDEARHSQTWRDEDLKRIELKPREVRLTAYEAARYPLLPKQVPKSKGGKELRLGSEREHVFQLTEGESTPEVVSLLLARFPRPLASSVLPAESTASGALLFEIPVFHRQRQGGASGNLRVFEQYVLFAAEKAEASRFWRYQDLRDIGRLGRYGFELATYEKQLAADGKSYIFDLKRPLAEAEYDKLWARVYAHSRN